MPLHNADRSPLGVCREGCRRCMRRPLAVGGAADRGDPHIAIWAMCRGDCRLPADALSKIDFIANPRGCWRTLQSYSVAQATSRSSSRKRSRNQCGSVDEIDRSQASGVTQDLQKIANARKRLPDFESRVGLGRARSWNGSELGADACHVSGQ